MKKLLILVILIGALIGTLTLNAQESSSKKGHVIPNDHEHGKEENDHGHGKEEDDHGHGKEEDDHGHGKDEDDHGHDKDEDDHGHGDEDDHGHGGGKAVGPGKAILEVSEAKGFKLSKEAFHALNVKFMDIEQDSIKIRKDVLVSYQNKTGVYRYRNEFFKFIPVTIKEQKQGQYFVQSPALQSGDKVVTSPVGLIRITDVYSTDTAEYGHGH